MRSLIKAFIRSPGPFVGTLQNLLTLLTLNICQKEKKKVKVGERTTKIIMNYI